MEDFKNDKKKTNIKAIEKLSDELEQLYKELEIYQKENIVLESFLTRLDEDNSVQEFEEDFMDGELLLEQKYEIALAEEEYLKSCIEEGKNKSEAMMDTLRALLEEADMTMKELRKEAIDFQRNIIDDGEASKGNRIDAARLIRYRQKVIKEKQAEVQKLFVKKANMDAKLSKMLQTVKKRTFGNEDLKFIDFHQLQIENKKFLKELEDKNKILQDLKVKVNSTD